jgi:dihydroflavonol-4-reductase
MGASGFLGSHVVKELAASGRDVRILVRACSDTGATDHLPLERHIGDLGDTAAIAAAIEGCETVYYCIVDTRAWLRDPSPLYETNVKGLKRVMDIALTAGIKRFVFTSTFGTIGINPSGTSTEKDSFNWWDKAPDYIKCRVEAENLFLSYCCDKGLPGVACCVGNTYGPDDVAPTPHGQLVRDSAMGKMPIYWDGGGPSVGIVDAARALVLAEEKGVIAERYIIAERWVDFEELFRLAATHAGKAPPKLKLPLGLLYLMAAVADVFTYISRRDNRFSVASLRCSTLLPNVDSAKARRELGWQPEAIEESIAQAVDYYLANPEV